MTTAARDEYGATLPALRPDDATAQEIAFSGTPVQSAAFGENTVVRITAKGADCRIAVGDNPTASGSSQRFIQDLPEYIRVDPGDKLSVVRDEAADGSINVVEQGP